MKHRVVVAAALTCLYLSGAATRSSTPAPQKSSTTAPTLSPPPKVANLQLPLVLEPNRGQTDSLVRFIVRSGSMTTFLTDRESFIVLARRKCDSSKDHFDPAEREMLPEVERTVLRMKLEGGRAPESFVGLEKAEGISNYFIGNDPSKWVTDVPNYRKVREQGVYPGIDLVYYGDRRDLEFDFVVQPGADPSQIHLAYTGAESLATDQDGNLLIATRLGTLVQQKPKVYQEIGGRRHEVAGGYTVRGRNVEFALATWDRGHELVIDPVLVYSTYLGGGGVDYGFGIAVDAVGAVYITGSTSSSDFPTTSGVYQTTFGYGTDVFVSKLNADGSGLVYSTYLGGSGDNVGGGIAVDASGAAYIAGSTSSSSFPTTPGTVQTTYGGNYDAFAVKLSPDGKALLYSTYLGGSENDYGTGIALNASGAAYVTGSSTNNTNFPTTPGAYQTISGGGLDAIIAKLSPDGKSLVYSTYLGGPGADQGRGIAVDAEGAAYVTGDTTGSFPVTSGAYQTAFGGGASFGPYRDAFVAKLDPDGKTLTFSTYLGGSGNDYGYAIAVDAGRAAYVVGFTDGSRFPTTPGAYRTTFGGGSSDAFAAKLNPGGEMLAYSTYLGGSGGDIATGIAVDTDGAAYVTGITSSGNFPTTPSALQSSYGGTGDAFVTKLSAAGNALAYSTYLGGSVAEQGHGIAKGGGGTVYVTGFTSSNNFPSTPGAFQTTKGELNSAINAFAVKISLEPFTVSLSGFSPQSATAGGSTFTLSVTGAGFVAGSIVQWNGSPLSTNYVSGSQLSATVPANLIATAGTAQVTIINPGGGASNSFLFSVNSTAQVISWISPESVTAGDRGFTLAVSGFGFVTGSVVQWNGSPLSTTFRSSGRLTATVPPNLITAAGTASVTVVNPGGAASNPVQCAITASMPVISSLTPNSLTAGELGCSFDFTLAVDGSGFLAGSQVQWNGSPLDTSFVNSRRLNATAAANLVAAPGTASLRVINPGGFASNPVTFTINANANPAVPVISTGGIVIHGGVTPQVSPGSLVDIYGSNLTTSAPAAAAGSLPTTLRCTQILVNQVAAPLIYISPSLIIFQLPYETPVGTAEITVSSNSLTSTAPVTVQQAAPSILTYGTNRAVVQNEDYSVNTSTNGAAPNHIMMAYLIGSGPLDKPIPTGATAPVLPLSNEKLPTLVTVGGMQARVQFAGLAPYFVGLMQVNFYVPNLAPGDYPLQITIGTAASNLALVTVSEISGTGY